MIAETQEAILFPVLLLFAAAAAASSKSKPVEALHDSMINKPNYVKANIAAIRAALDHFGITNKFVQAGIIATAAKESGLVPQSESSYAGTSVQRIRQVFGSRVADLTDVQLDTLKKDSVKFFDKVYGGRYGNTAPGDGFKYRGRGFNQITFKDIYALTGKRIGVDLVSNPDKLNEVPTAALALAGYFKELFDTGKKGGYLANKFGVDDINKISTTDLATKVAIQANAGWKTDFNNSTVQEGYKKASSVVNDIYNA